MEFINGKSIKELLNPGVVSRQLINPENSKSERVTVTEVHLEVGASQPKHKLPSTAAGTEATRILPQRWKQETFSARLFFGENGFSREK